MLKRGCSESFGFEHPKKGQFQMNATIIKNSTVADVAGQMTDSDFAEAVDFGRSENLMQEIAKDYETLGLVGEYHNKLLSYIAAVSRKMDVPMSILILSSSGAGKSTIQDKTLKLCSPEDVNRVSGLSDKALFYKGKNALKNKLLAIEENAGLNDDYAIRTLISEGYLQRETVVKQGNGFQTVSQRLDGPCAVFQTTTNPEINAETKSRFWVLGVDESRSQTRTILEQQRHNQTLEGVIAKAREKFTCRRHWNFQRLLQPIAVVNPFAEDLFYADDRLNARRNQPKFLNLCKAVAFLRQMTKEVQTYTDEVMQIEYIEVDRLDIEIATEIASEILGKTLDDLSVPARDLLDLLYGFVLSKQGSDEEQIRRKQVYWTRREIMDFSGWGKTRLHIHLKELLDSEYVVKSAGGENCLQSYRLLWNGEGKNGGKFLLGFRQCS